MMRIRIRRRLVSLAVVLPVCVVALASPAVAAPSPTTAMQKMIALTMTSAQTLDMRGVESSMYRGKFYRSAAEDRRRCIIKRESEGHYDVVSHNGYRGAYQVSNALARGMTWMMLPEHKALLGDVAAERILADLRKTPMNEWPRYWQDAAFFTVFNYESPGSGARHWAGGRWHC